MPRSRSRSPPRRSNRSSSRDRNDKRDSYGRGNSDDWRGNRRDDQRQRDDGHNGREKGGGNERDSNRDDRDKSRYERSDRGEDPRYAPYVSNPYGPNNSEGMPSKLADEGHKEWRARVRQEMEMRISIWNRSPSPPKQKSKVAAKVVTEKKEIIPMSVKTKSKETKTSKKRKNSTTSDSSSSSDSESSSDSSSSSSSSESESDSSSSEDRKKKKSKSKRAKDKKASEKKKEEKRKKKHGKKSDVKSDKPSAVDNRVEKQGEISKMEKDKAYIDNMNIEEAQKMLETQNALHGALGLDRYEKEEMERFRRDVQGDNRKVREEQNDSDDDIGPLPMVQPEDYAENKEMSYGGALMPGEGAAIAMYVQQNMRIPRRGEIGWSGEEINGLEDEGYVMSGSRHARMNAVRIRKENQVYSAEEKRALALITFEEKQQKDNKVVGDFRQMLTQKLITSGHIPAEEDEEGVE
mmetsp:Transcript_26197/g.25036  ORF Transcript_26197/g.25036 Transcript_26197/m.25036 type:complete len:464 (+) Transcript_26197:123-1514(+)|eukprot:CAMPEP_0119035316 /NCGR_PEP_ID=MMETSP1177-20130426/2245_1 /TAXON_ID=2985 /ORGANISM="Ochromonas sp, Strain CCMP1899" /LENGTH=463 /DNA_ID=CAMNT_0006993369 /DNA_START=94 /DNA_END=1485 /DNA_ORIENTATION=+